MEAKNQISRTPRSSKLARRAHGEKHVVEKVEKVAKLGDGYDAS
jgi:hypothetical protein